MSVVSLDQRIMNSSHIELTHLHVLTHKICKHPVPHLKTRRIGQSSRNRHAKRNSIIYSLRKSFEHYSVHRLAFLYNAGSPYYRSDMGHKFRRFHIRKTRIGDVDVTALAHNIKVRCGKKNIA